jgi:ubiquinone/menaquinone biosynthesis C-methylase UbiE
VEVGEKRRVQEFWEAGPCGAKLVADDVERGSAEFYAELEAERYRLEPFIPGFAEFDRWLGKDVLEVGVGLGSDFVRFARAGARLHGIDLTEAAVALVRRRLELEGLSAEVTVADAEALPFADESFDLVYSWGVLHHTPDTQRALREVRRVLRPGGEARVMLYARRSWVGLGLWLRHALARGRPWHSLSHVIARHMESPGTKAYTPRELERLFRDAGFASVETVRFLTPYDRRVGGPLTRLTGDRLGWFAGVRAGVAATSAS